MASIFIFLLFSFKLSGKSNVLGNMKIPLNIQKRLVKRWKNKYNLVITRIHRYAKHYSVCYVLLPKCYCFIRIRMQIRSMNSIHTWNAFNHITHKMHVAKLSLHNILRLCTLMSLLFHYSPISLPIHTWRISMRSDIEYSNQF